CARFVRAAPGRTSKRHWTRCGWRSRPIRPTRSQRRPRPAIGRHAAQCWKKTGDGSWGLLGSVGLFYATDNTLACQECAGPKQHATNTARPCPALCHLIADAWAGVAAKGLDRGPAGGFLGWQADSVRFTQPCVDVATRGRVVLR